MVDNNSNTNKKNNRNIRYELEKNNNSLQAAEKDEVCLMIKVSVSRCINE